MRPPHRTLQLATEKWGIRIGRNATGRLALDSAAGPDTQDTLLFGGPGAPALIATWRTDILVCIQRRHNGQPLRPTTVSRLAKALEVKPADLMARPEADVPSARKVLRK